MFMILGPQIADFQIVEKRTMYQRHLYPVIGYDAIHAIFLYIPEITSVRLFIA